MLALLVLAQAEVLVERWADARFWILNQGRKVGWQRYQVKWEDCQGARALRVDFERANSRFWGASFTAWLKPDETLTPLEVRQGPGWATIRVAKGQINPGQPFSKPAPKDLTLFPEMLAAILPLKEGAERTFSRLSVEASEGHASGPLRVLAQEEAPFSLDRAWKVACPSRQQYSINPEEWDTTLWIKPDRTLARSRSTIRYDSWDGKKMTVQEDLVPMKAEDWTSTTLASNEIFVAAQVSLLADLSRTVRANDLDGNGQNDCWTGDVSGLHRLLLTDKKEPIRLISKDVALADAAPLPGGPEKGGCLLGEALGPKPVPFRGYFFRMLSKGASEGAPIVLNDGSNHHPHSYAICAYPAEYGKTGRLTFLVTEQLDPFWKDLKGQSLEAVPLDLAKDRWQWAGPRR